MPILEKPKDAIERKFVADESLRFRVNARRNKLFGLWAAGRLNRENAEAYAKEVVIADFEEAGDADVVRKVLGDFLALGIQTTEDELRRELARCFEDATEQLLAEQI